MNLTKEDLDQTHAAEGDKASPELPVIEKPAPVMAAVFAPNQFDMPDANALANILMISGLIRLGPIAGNDKQGNLVSHTGDVIVPAALRRYFQIANVQPEGATPQ